MNSFRTILQGFRKSGTKGFALLLDPADIPQDDLPNWGRAVREFGPDCVLVGGSLVGIPDLDRWVAILKSLVQVPVVLFPGNVGQVTGEADAVLFLSLISGRNPDLLIGQHVHAAPLLEKLSLEIIPTGYLLIDTGVPTSAQYMSQTLPIPGNKPELAAYTALAGAYLGLQAMYLDAGSGAARPISVDMVAKVRRHVEVPLLVGGGIRTPEDATRLLAAGADMFVVGTALEEAINGHALRHSLADFARVAGREKSP